MCRPPKFLKCFLLLQSHSSYLVRWGWGTLYSSVTSPASRLLLHISAWGGGLRQPSHDMEQSIVLLLLLPSLLLAGGLQLLTF